MYSGGFMQKHIVMWKIVDSFEGMDKLQIAQKIKDSLTALTSQIAEIRFLEVGIDVGTSCPDADIVLVTEFDNAEDLKFYAGHPLHVEAGKFIKKVALKRYAVDYEV